jgi:hypothetical protein
MDIESWRMMRRTRLLSLAYLAIETTERATGSRASRVPLIMSA